MRVSYRWLCELLPGLRATPTEVAEQLTNVGLEVEATELFGEGLEEVRVVVVRKVERHPSSSKLTLVTVEREASQLQCVVCGAPNVPEPGGLVALAPAGTRLPRAGITVQPRKVAGVMSSGMLCSEAELGLGDDASGILILPQAVAAPGTPLTQALPAASDTTFDLGVTPNRPDALGHVGVARDLAAIGHLELSLPETSPVATIAHAELGELVSVENRAPERCPHYGAAAVLEVDVGPSPLWLRWRLFSLGIRPISNVVDIARRFPPRTVTPATLPHKVIPLMKKPLMRPLRPSMTSKAAQ